MHGFYDKYQNPDGKHFKNQYEIKRIKGNKIVIDGASGLMWQHSGSFNNMNFEAAKKWIIGLNQNVFAGFTDWRLPTIEEAMSLMEPERKENKLYIDNIFDDKQRYIWTCDTFENEKKVWVVGYHSGRSGFNGFYGLEFVRAVRSAESSQE